MKGFQDLRKLGGASQWDIARATGIDRSRISLIETGHVRASTEEEVAIRRALGKAMRARLSSIQTALGCAGTPASV